MTVPPGAEPLGDKLYIFKSKTNIKDVLISAHGGYYRASRTFNVPAGVAMKFYGEHEKVLSDPGMKLMHLNPAVVEEIAAGEPCIDYILSKYQGRHSDNKETYDSIDSAISTEDRKITSNMLKWASAQNSAERQKHADQLQYYRSMSVVTIRNRFMRSDLNLSYVVGKVTQALPGIESFHCSFCRSNIGADDPEVAKVQFQPF